jgi:hypothetical protein
MWGLAAWCVLLFAGDHDPLPGTEFLAAFTVALAVAVAPLLWLIGRHQYRMFGATRLTLDGPRIERRRGDGVEQLNADGIRSIEVWSLPSGRPYQIRLKRGPFRGQTLAGFDSMATIASDLETSLGRGAPFQHRRFRLDWSKPAIWIFMWFVQCGAVALVVVALATAFSANSLSLVAGVGGLALGAYALLTGPTSRVQGPSTSWDRWLGAFWLFYGAYYLIRFLQA